MNKKYVIFFLSIIFFNPSVFGMETDATFAVITIKKRWRGHEKGALESLEEVKKQPGILRYRTKKGTLGSFEASTGQVVTYVNGKPYPMSFEKFREIITTDFGSLTLKNHECDETDIDPLVGQYSEKPKKCCCLLQ